MAAIEAFAKARRLQHRGGVLRRRAVSGADPVAERQGFAAMLERIAGNGVPRTIVVESPDRFARDRRAARRSRFPQVDRRGADPGLGARFSWRTP
jgi:DNA invertase Pin-like site-specific DNA recombinase